MNYKATAMIVAVSMIVVAMSGAVMTGDSDAAADADEIYTNGTIQVDSDGATRELKVNEQEFAGYNYTLTWKAAALDSSSDTGSLDGKVWTTVLTSTNTLSSGTPSISYNDDGTASIGNSGSTFTVDVTHDSGAAVGVYSLSVRAGSDTANLGVQCEIKVTVGGMEKTLASVYYIYTLKAVDEVVNDITLKSMTMTTNTTFGDYVEEYTTTLLGDVQNYYWYATGLPAGISMSENGYVSGVPLVATEDAPVNAKVVATDKSTGDTYEGVLSITVTEYTQSVTGFYFELEMEGQDTETVTNGDSFAVVQGETVTLRTYSGDSSDSSLVAVVSVTAIAADGTVSPITTSDIGVYNLSSAGTGAYRIVIDVDGTNTVSFYLFVTPSLDNISAGIVVSGN